MMKKNVFLMGWLCCIASIAGADAVQFSESGVEALTDVIIVTDEEIGNSFESTESIGIAIMENGNVIVGWEDDNNEVQEIAGAFVVYNPQGERLTPLRAYADDDGNPTPVAGGWGPKIQSNWFGAGATFGTTFYEFGYVDSLAHLQDTGDAPVIQLVDNDGSFIGSAISAFPDDFLTGDPGDIRISDVAYLSDGNIIVTGQSSAANPAHHANYFNVENAADQLPVGAVVNPQGETVHELRLLHDSGTRGSMWHGLATFDGGFVVRYELDGEGPYIRFFNNDFTPITDPILLADIDPAIAEGGRGDATGLEGNGGDRVILISGGGDPHFVVFDTEGNVVVDPTPVEDFPIGSSRNDAALDENGNIVVAYSDNVSTGDSALSRVVLRFFNADGTPATSPFFVYDMPEEDVLGVDQQPRVAMRNGIVAVAWLDTNYIMELPDEEIALRIFESPFGGTDVSEWALY
ncbi:MAG: hypothetical protein ACOX5R_17720 [bacterium]